jgi:hypothetical protein
VSQTKKRRYNFFLSDDLRLGLAKLKARDGVPESESIRRALARYLEEQGVIKKSRQRKQV